MHIHSPKIKQEGFEPQVVVLRVTNTFMVNYNYLVIDPMNNVSIIVDPAWDMEKIERAILNSNTKLRGVLLTHAHMDHIHLAKPLADKYNCPIWMSYEEIADSAYSARHLQAVETQSWWVGGLKITPLLTPGHTPGSMSYLIGNNLFSGDTLFAEGCGLCPDINSAHDMFESLQYIKRHIKSNTRIFPGHNYGKSPGQEYEKILRFNIYLQFNNKHDFASYRLRKGQSHAALFAFQ